VSPEQRKRKNRKRGSRTQIARSAKMFVAFAWSFLPVSLLVPVVSAAATAALNQP
jgi:hypothetical protein